MNGIIKRIGGWLSASLLTAIVGVGLQTQNVLAKLSEIGADVSFGERLSMTGYDIFHLGSIYVLFVGMAFAVAFLAGGLVFRIAKFGRPIIFMVAGAVALLVMLMLMKEVFFNTHVIAGARDSFGLGLQMLAGALGGFVFARVSLPKTTDQKKDLQAEAEGLF